MNTNAKHVKQKRVKKLIVIPPKFIHPKRHAILHPVINPALFNHHPANQSHHLKKPAENEVNQPEEA